MRRPALTWVAALGSLTILDIWCARNATVGDSLSECTRAALKTHTRAGRVVFVASWALLTCWFVPHICRSTRDFIDEM